MKKSKLRSFRFVVCLLAAAAGLFAQPPASPSLRGVVRDPSGSLVPNAVVELRGPGGARTNTTGADGIYSFTPLTPGKYNLKITATGFATAQRNNVEISQPSTLDVQIAIE